MVKVYIYIIYIYIICLAATTYGFHQQMGRSLNCQSGFCQEPARDLQVWKQFFMHLSQQALICHEDINHLSVAQWE